MHESVLELNRLTVTAFFLAILLSGAMGEEIIGEKHSVEINSNGFAHVVERYYYSFEHPFDRNEFILTVEKNGSSLLNWIAYDQHVAPHFGTDQTVANADISYDSRANQLKLEYDIVDQPFATNVNEESRFTVWQVSDRQFSQFQKGSIFVIPTQTEISVSFPQNAEFDQTTILPTPTSSDSGSVTWKGYLPSNQINVSYRVNKPIAPTLDLQTLWNSVQKNPINLAIAAAIALLGLYVYWKRKEIGEQIEDYIVSHSEIAEKEGEEIEVEAD